MKAMKWFYSLFFASLFVLVLIFEAKAETEYTITDSTNLENHKVYNQKVVGDLDGDEKPDVIVFENNTFHPAYVFLQKSIGEDGNLDISKADYKITEEVYGADIDAEITDLGDDDNDGMADLYIGEVIDDDDIDESKIIYASRLSDFSTQDPLIVSSGKSPAHGVNVGVAIGTDLGDCSLNPTLTEGKWGHIALIFFLNLGILLILRNRTKRYDSYINM